MKALIIVDVWDNHWEKQTVKQLPFLVERINAFTRSFRDGGIIIHAPSDIKIKKRTEGVGRNFAVHDKQELRRGLEEQGFPCQLKGNPKDFGSKGKHVWTKIHPDLDVHQEDYITNSGQDVYNILGHHGIDELYYCGMHINICVLWSHSFSILNMKRNGVTPLLVEDLSLSLPVDHKSQIISFYNSNICKSVRSVDI